MVLRHQCKAGQQAPQPSGLRSKQVGFAAIGALLLAQAMGCRNDDTRTRSVGVPGSLPAAPPELPNDEATPSKATSASRESDSLHRGALQDGGLAVLHPTPLRDDSRLLIDTPTAKDSTGVTLEAEWKAIDWPALPATSAIDHDRLVEIRNKTKWSLRIDLVGSGRMRMILASRGFPFEKGTEIRSRVDLLGHLLFWPDENQFRILPVGTMRSLFQEGRVDAGSMAPATLKSAGSGRFMDWETERQSVTSSFGHMAIDQTTVFAAGVSGRLLCRWLVEFISAEPASSVCQNDTIPVRVLFEFAGGGKAEFAVTQIGKKQEYNSSSIAVPPPTAVVNQRDLPRAAASSNTLLVEYSNRASSHGSATPPATTIGLVAVNHALGLRALIVDGIVAAWLMAAEERSLPELLPGNYSVSWRDFLGVSVEPPKNVTLPARISLGAAP
jgi:hypothetical protein